jgi:PAS domain S-box-containing protein
MISSERTRPNPDFAAAPARVLIVDDDDNRKILEVMLAPEGFDLTSAASGEEALAMVARQPPDLILLDIMMPGIDGYEVTSKIKGALATKNIPIIMVTALDSRDARMLGLSAGAEDFLTKPVDRAELCVRVRNLLRLKAYGDYHDKYRQMLEDEVGSRTADLVERTHTLEQHATALRRSEERTTYALSAARMGVWEIDVATWQLTWSDTMAPMFGLSPDQAPDTVKAFLALIHADDRQLVEDSLATTMRDGTDYEVEFRALWPDGSTHWNAGQARMVRDGRGIAVRLLGVGTDISERKSLEAQFRQSQKMEAVGQLAGGIAHDFNNLLTAILGYSTFVIDTFGSHDQQRRADMEQVIQAGQRAVALTRQLLAFSRKQVLQPAAVDLNALVTGMRQMLGRLIGEDVDLVPVLAPDLGIVRADPGQLEQVLMNLVVNARDAMPSGGRVAIETANVELDQSFMRGVTIARGSYVMLAVSDNGAGMNDATKQRLFEPFFTTKEHGKGTGLGLATVYGIVKQSGGYIWVDSEAGKGAAFKIYLPRAHGKDQAAPVPVIEQIASGTESILLVEDEAGVRLMTRRMLEQAGYQVVDAANPAEAAALFERHAGGFDLLVTDVIMPGSSGPSLFERLERLRPELKVLYVSGYTDDSIVHQGRIRPGHEFLQKPFTADSLNRRVRTVLDR